MEAPLPSPPVPPIDDSSATRTQSAIATTTKQKPKPRVRRVRRPRNPIPDSLLNDPNLAQAMRSLPSSYNFEVYKTIHTITTNKYSVIALQMPEGLLMYGPILSDIIKRFTATSIDQIYVMGDVTYGACCVDDLSARELGVEFLVHYGHSCLVPVGKTKVRTMYVFVEIRVDYEHLVSCVLSTLSPPLRINIMGTVQFRSAIAESNEALRDAGFITNVPQAKPLSPGEVLGCTSPNNLFIEGESEGGKDQVILFIADGRFHLEAAMIANPRCRAMKYDPYSKVLTEESYDIAKMRKIRYEAILKAKEAKTIGIVLGTLGRQGNPAILCRVKSLLKNRGLRSFVVLLSEILPKKLSLMPAADAWVQIACPRLSVDWGHFFHRPVLTVYELEVMVGESKWYKEEDGYPMDYYKEGDHGWGNYGAGNGAREYDGFEI